MTKLEAVNICLSGLGEPSVPDLDADGGLDVVMILGIIEETTQYLNNKNWYWNTETKKLTPVNGEIILPTGTLRADTVGHDRNVNVVKRGNRLYNLDTNSFTFAQPVLVEYSFTVPFDEMPSEAQYYITAHASLTAQQRVLGSESLDKFLQSRAKDAWVDLVRSNSKAADYNILGGSNSTSRILQRGIYPRGGAA